VHISSYLTTYKIIYGKKTSTDKNIQLSDVSHVKCSVLTNILASSAVAAFRVNAQ
jgi:hypothetical protein